MPIIFPRKFADHLPLLAHNHSMIDVQQMTPTCREAVANRIGLPGVAFAPLTKLAPQAPLSGCFVNQRVNNSPKIRRKPLKTPP